MITGKRLKEARENKGLTQTQLAQMIGVKAAEISQYESGKRKPRWNKFNKILDILEVTADYILGREISVREEENYTVKLAKEDLQILSQIKDCPKLYKILLDDPERKVVMINQNLKNVLPEIDK